MMLARLQLQLATDEPWLSVEDGALFPVEIAQVFAEALASTPAGCTVRLIQCSASSARLLYPDAYQAALVRFPTVLTAPANQGTTPNEEPPACQRQGF